jgi:predicted Zn finger-like uncharacterized protein
MKIVCDACQAKYSIADDKIQGKAFKIRCKKCNHIIVVKTSGEVSAGSASASAEKQKAAAAAAAAAVTPGVAATDQGVWHVVVDGEQVGPLTEADVKEKLRANQIHAETLVWKEGLADWTALSTVPELAALQSKGRSTGARAAVNEPARGSASARSTFPSTASPSPDAGDVFAAATVITPASTDLFAATATPGVQSAQAVPSPVAPAPSSPFLFGGASAQQAEPAIVIKNPGNGAGGTHLTGQRNENSVLFSLSNLEALAVPAGSGGGGGARPPSSTSNTEGSGLIDIRSMAAMTLHDGGGDGRRSSESLPTFSTPQFSPVAPVLLPISSSGPPKWVYPVLGLLAVGILVLGYGIYRVMAGPPPGNPIIMQAAPLPVAPVPVAPPAAAQPAPAPAPAANPEAAKPTDDKSAASAEDKAIEKPGKGASKGEKTRHKGDSSSKKDKESMASGDAKGKSDKGKKESISNALPDFGKKEEPPKPAPPQVKLMLLTQSDIVNAMKGVQPKVQLCANQFKVPGTAMATISVAAGGKVNNATVTGKFAGTPTGDCVAVAAKSAKFPPCQSMTFPWPFTLSPR